MESVAKRCHTATAVVALPGVELKLTAEYALRAAIDTQVFSTLRELEPLDGGRAVQAVYVALVRRLPNVTPDRKRIATDCGYSESSVKRAIKLLETCGLVTVKRVMGQSSVYHLADLRSADIATRCVAAMRKMLRGVGRKPKASGRVTSEPTNERPRVTSGLTGRLTCGSAVGPQVAQKEAIKNQRKQQCAAAQTESCTERALETVLERWGLSSARYLVQQGHDAAIPVLVANATIAAELIDRTMRQASWSVAAGVGAKVAYLRDHVGESLRQSEQRRQRATECEAHARREAANIAATLARRDTANLQSVEPRRFAGLLKRGLERLGTRDEVLRVLAGDEVVRERVVSGEVVREKLGQTLLSIGKSEFCRLREELFGAHPGLGLLYGTAGPESTGLRLRLIEFLYERSVAKQGEEGKKEGGVRGNLERWLPEQGRPIE